MLWSHREFLRGIWSDWSPILHQKKQLFGTHFDFKKHLQFRIFSKVFHVSCNIFRLVRFEHFYVSLPLRTNLIQHFRYPQNVFWMCRKVFRGFWNHLSFQWKDHFLTFFCSEFLWENRTFWRKSRLQTKFRAIKMFYHIQNPFYVYWTGCSKRNFIHERKSDDHTKQQSQDIGGNEKKQREKLQKQRSFLTSNVCKKSHFHWKERWFQNPLKNFLHIQNTFCGYLKCCMRLDLNGNET